MPHTIKPVTGIFTYAIGISLVALLPALPSVLAIALIGASGLVLMFVIMSRSLWVFIPLAGLVAGLAVGMGYGLWFQHSQLPSELEGQVLELEGTLTNLPVQMDTSSHFVFLAKGERLGERVMQMRLRWYSAPALSMGQYWRLKIKLRSPHGFASPGAMDFEAWAAREGIQATGYVLSGELLSRPGGYVIRQKINDWLAGSVSFNHLGILKALLLGEKSGITAGQWQLLNSTGTTHLVVISGLHIGLMALIGYWLAMLLARAGLLPLLHVPLPRIVALLSLSLAGTYALMAGFAVPVQRALIMTTVAMAGPAFGLRPSPLTLLVLAFAAVVTLDPLAVTSMGFWYSFSAVGVLIYGLSGRYGKTGLMAKLFRPQWLVFCIITPLLLFNGQPVSLFAPFINLLAIPFVGLLIVPLLLFSAMAGMLYQPLSSWLLSVIEHLLNTFWWGLERCADCLPMLSGNCIPASSAVIFALLGGVLLVSPLPGFIRVLAPVFFLPWFFPDSNKPDNGQAIVTVLDVGQGLSVLVRTRHHTLVYDTGDAFTERFNAADCVIVPYLRKAGVTSIDRVIISHGDKDHAGGLKALLKHYDCSDIHCGTLIPYFNRSVSFCETGQQWQWDDVQFKVLASGGHWKKTNDRSCVLKVTAGNESVLLAGDISYRMEECLLRTGESLQSTVLLAPHHGSRFSSSPDFLKAVNPSHVLFSSGHKNRFGHPAKATLKRVAVLGAKSWNTAWHGSLSFNLGKGDCEISAYRCSHRRYWWANDRLNLDQSIKKAPVARKE